MSGPDFTHCGQPVEWTDAAPIDDRFPAVLALAYAQPGVDIELCRWSPDEPVATAYVEWWNGQRGAIRRHLAAEGGSPVGTKLVVSRRTDKGDGLAKCYVRVDRVRPRIRAAS